jgi:hypothetical protein
MSITFEAPDQNGLRVIANAPGEAAQSMTLPSSELQGTAADHEFARFADLTAVLLRVPKIEVQS